MVSSICLVSQNSFRASCFISINHKACVTSDKTSASVHSLNQSDTTRRHPCHSTLPSISHRVWTACQTRCLLDALAYALNIFPFPKYQSFILGKPPRRTRLLHSPWQLNKSIASNPRFKLQHFQGTSTCKLSTIWVVRDPSTYLLMPGLAINSVRIALTPSSPLPYFRHTSTRQARPFRSCPNPEG